MAENEEKEEGTENDEYTDDEIDSIMDDDELAGSEAAGSKTRSKNTKLALIGGVALVLIAAIYFGSTNLDILLEKKDQLMVMVGLKKETPKISEEEKAALEEEKARLEAIAQLEEEERLAALKNEPAPEEDVAEEVTEEPESEPVSEPAPQHAEETVKEESSKIKESEIASGGEPIEPSEPPAETPPVKAVAAPPMASSGEFAIQAGTFGVKQNAIKLIKKFTDQGYQAYGIPHHGSGKYHTVNAGPFYSKPEAQEAAREMKSNGIRSPRVTYDSNDASYLVVAGKSKSAYDSEMLAGKVRRLGYKASSEYKKGAGAMTVVYVGNFATRAEAEKVRRNLPKKEVPSSLIVKSPKQRR